MITIKPFKALRPRNDLCSSIVSLPYDVVTNEEVREIVSKKPLSFLRIVRSEVDLEPNIDPHTEEVYIKAKENMEEYIKKGYLIQDEKPNLYVYRLIKGDYNQIGFVAAVSVADYDQDRIKKHEKTRPDKEDDRVKHMDTTSAHTGFVFLAYRAEEELGKILKDIQETVPENDFSTDDNVRHTFWLIKDKSTIDFIVNKFKSIKNLYVADGHHRSAASSRVAKMRRENNMNKGSDLESEYFLSIIYPDDCLNILPYNRAVKDLNGKTINDFKNKIENSFVIEKVEANDDDGGYKPQESKNIGMYLDGDWYLLRPKHCIVDDDPVQGLDVSILQNYLLDPLLGIKDPRTDQRIDFIGGVRGSGFLKKVVDNGKYAVSFSMYPTSIAELMAVADANKLMPPKSTWFEPKPRSGFAVHLLN